MSEVTLLAYDFALNLYSIYDFALPHSMYLLPVNLFQSIRLEYSFTCTHVKSVSFNQMNENFLTNILYNTCTPYINLYPVYM